MTQTLSQRVHEVMVAREQFDTITRVTERALDAVSKNPRTSHLGTFNRTCVAIGVESANFASMEEADGVRNILAKAGIGAMAQKLFDLIRKIFNKIMGRGGHQLAENVHDILTTIKEINGVRYTKAARHQLPRFANSQEQANWESVWDGYRKTMATVDPRLENVTVKDFYMNYTVPRDRQFYILLGNSIASSIGIPPCYALGNRSEALREYMEILSKTRQAIKDLREAEINDDRTALTYNKEAIQEFVKQTDSVYNQKWRRVKYNEQTRQASHPEWVMDYKTADLMLMRNIDIYINDLGREMDRMVKQVDMRRLYESTIARTPEEQLAQVAEPLRRSISDWMHLTADVVSSISNIHAQIGFVDDRLSQNLKSYRRILDLIHRE